MTQAGMMNNGHLPAGRPVHGAAAPGVDMGPGPGGGGGGGAPRGGRGGRQSYLSHYGQPHQQHQQHQQHPQHQHQHQHVNHQMYSNYPMNPYSNPYYTPMPPHFAQSGGMGNGYVPYPHQYARSPPPMQQQFAPMMGSGIPQHQFARPAVQQSPVIVTTPHLPPPQQQSPAMPTPYQAPPLALHGVPPLPRPEPTHVPAAAVTLPPTPSSTHSSQAAPTPISPASSQAKEATLPTADLPPVNKASAPRDPFRPPLPWLSHPDDPFPAKTTKSRRRRKIIADSERIELPTNHQDATAAAMKADSKDAGSAGTEVAGDKSTPEAPAASRPVGLAETSSTPSTQDQPSEYATSTSATTPSSVQAGQPSTTASTTPTQSSKPASRAAVPALPIIPAIPKVTPQATKPAPSTEKKAGGTPLPDQASEPEDNTGSSGMSWGDLSSDSLFVKPLPQTGRVAAVMSKAAADEATAAAPEAKDGNGKNKTTGFAESNSNSMAEALRAYRVGEAEKVAFIEPRGLINTGNMCYMNSVLQVLVFCNPFYDFLDEAGKKAAHSFKSETPLIDSMIMFMREFKVIDSAVDVNQLRRRLKTEELEQYGEPFTPEFVYGAIKQLSRFSHMKRGHQQDAEEFLGFLLECLNEECAQIMRPSVAPSSANAPSASLPTPTLSSPENAESSGGWLEVGPRQRAAITRSSGVTFSLSPVNRIFGGQLRSELKIPGLKASVTLQTYQSLQLDIDSLQVRNIVDALKGITKPETIHGNFDSPHGKDVPASKQVFIESLPPVLILHLKRFQFDGEGFGTVKIWKKIGYPLELEIPREVLSRQRRNTITAEGGGLPKYRLTAVVYHHGKHASGGHYTVDVLRQDGREWIRLDDTVIRRVRSEDVAEGGAEEDPMKTAEAAKKDTAVTGGGSNNRFAGMGDQETGDTDDGWKQVSTPASGAKKWSSVVNGSGSTTPKGRQIKDGVKENKVAYLLFYYRI